MYFYHSNMALVLDLYNFDTFSFINLVTSTLEPISAARDADDRKVVK